ncbi:hypothetical protein LTR53_001211 [Teratosphaeriaceae sp. CCFEE 6253]|nr:hypothetical protein LTR53_001211 [Teratosphaeriaceae sp. CCFEE 6253]
MMQSPTTVQFNAPTAGSTAHGRKQGTKRAKYAARACLQCKRRKVKCSGADEEACQQLRVKVFNAVPHLHHLGPGTLMLRLMTALFGSDTLSAAFATDPRVDGLCDRLHESAKVASNALSPTAFLGTSLRPTATEDEDDDGDNDDADQFVAGARVLDDVSLSSHVAAMGALLSRPPSPGPRRSTPNTKPRLLDELPELLEHLLDVYFHDFDGYSPFLDCQELESRVYSIIRRLGYSAYNLVLLASVDDLSIIAILCIMIALAECLDPKEGVCDGDSKPGWERYNLCSRAIRRLPHSNPLDLDVVRAQTLSAAYLMHCEALKAASQAVTVAWQLAVSIRLNNQKVWPKGEPKETLQRQQLWWTIYYLDRQTSRRSGIAYHIRDTEFDVDDFIPSKRVIGINFTAK